MRFSKSYFVVDVKLGTLTPTPAQRAERRAVRETIAQVPEGARRYRTRAGAERALARLLGNMSDRPELAEWLTVHEQSDLYLSF